MVQGGPKVNNDDENELRQRDQDETRRGKDYDVTGRRGAGIWAHEEDLCCTSASCTQDRGTCAVMKNPELWTAIAPHISLRRCRQ